MGSDTSSRRNQNVMCGRCRHDKRKCTPVERDWDNQRQKCDRCSRLQYDCGPPERAPRKSRQRSLTTSFPCEEHCRRNAGMTSDSSGFGLQYHNFHSRAPSPFLFHTADWNRGSIETTLVNTAFNPATANRPPVSHFGMVLAGLGDLYATRELLRRELMLCNQVTEWLGISESLNMLKEAIYGYIEAIQSDLGKLLMKAYNHIASNNEPETDQSKLQCYLAAYKSAELAPSYVSSRTGNWSEFGTTDPPRLQQVGHTLHQNAFTYSDAEYICDFVWDLSQCPYRSSKTRQGWFAKLHDASKAIDRVLSNTTPSKSEHKEILFEQPTDVHTASKRISCYPIEHLMVMYGSPFLSLELSWGSTLDFHKPDLLKRSSVHTAVYAGRLNELKCILEHDSNAISTTSADSLGLTPFMIAVCKDDVATATLLLQHGADAAMEGPAGESIFATAVQRGSHSMVELLRCHGCAAGSPSKTPEQPHEPFGAQRKEAGTSLFDSCIKDEPTGDSNLSPNQAGMTAAHQKSTHETRSPCDDSTTFPFGYSSPTYVSDLSWSISSGSSCSDLLEKVGAGNTSSSDDTSSLHDYRKMIDLLHNLPEHCKDYILQQAVLTMERDITVSNTHVSTDLNLLRRCLGTASEKSVDSMQTKDVSLALNDGRCSDIANMMRLQQDPTEEFLLEWEHYGFDSTLLEYPDMPYEVMDLSTVTDVDLSYTT